MRRARTWALAGVVAVGMLGTRGAARADDDDDSEEDGEEDDDTVVVDDGKPKAKAKPEFKKQDLRGHAVDANASKNLFLKDRFFVDKVDTKKTAKSTLIQGSLQSSSFLYTESGGDITDPNGVNLGSSAGKFSRLFTDLRLQTDFRHIKGGRWDARADVRGRLVNSPEATRTGPAQAAEAPDPRVQSGFNGTNEAEIRELWITRGGKRSDLTFGRQFITDLGAVKIDGLRVDYASSERLTLLGFAGLFPLRGSRSITTDYPTLKNNQGEEVGRIVASGGFGGAYRTTNMHGALGAVVIAPAGGEAPRLFATSNGYLRTARQVDVYHFALLDILGSATDERTPGGVSSDTNYRPALTNLSVGANYKPNQRLRLTAAFNRVDTETLSFQANSFLNPIDATAGTKVQNETFLTRISTNAARVGVSAALGQAQRFEVSTATSVRYRPDVVLTTPDGTNVPLQAAKGVDVYFAAMDRRSFKDLRLGVDASRSFGIGQVAFQRSEVFTGRVFAARELRDGRGEWEAELGYTQASDKASGIDCLTPAGLPDPDRCFGTSQSGTINAAGNFYYRINRDWFALGTAGVMRQSIQRRQLMGTAVMVVDDPPILGITSYVRVAYRF